MGKLFRVLSKPDKLKRYQGSPKKEALATKYSVPIASLKKSGSFDPEKMVNWSKCLF